MFNMSGVFVGEVKVKYLLSAENELKNTLKPMLSFHIKDTNMCDLKFLV